MWLRETHEQSVTGILGLISISELAVIAKGIKWPLYEHQCLMRPKSETNCIQSANTLKPGLHISRKDCKHMVGNVYFKITDMACSPYRWNDRKFWYFTRNFFNCYPDSFEVLFEASSQACSAILTTIWRPGLRSSRQLDYIPRDYIKGFLNCIAFYYNFGHRNCWSAF